MLPGAAAPGGGPSILGVGRAADPGYVGRAADWGYADAGVLLEGACGIATGPAGAGYAGYAGA
jgi:hypothetical protein